MGIGKVDEIKELLKCEELENVMPMFKNRKTICFSDKYKRGVGLNFQEKEMFGGICSLGDMAMIECYGRYGKRYGDEYFSAYDICAMCSDCKYFNGRTIAKSFTFCEFKTADWQLFSPYYIYEILEKHIDPDDAKSYVYFIENDKHIKIGKADNCFKRLKALQVANSVPLKLLCQIPCKTHKDAIEVEGRLHNLYREYNVCGEWFDISRHLNRGNWEQMFPVSA